MRKAALLILTFFVLSQGSFAQAKIHQLSSHILDLTSGTPAADVKITLSKMDENDSWILIDEKITDANGRITDFLEQNGTDLTGIYKLTFHTAPYFTSLGQKSFYPFIEVVFELADDEHYHVPITLSPYGYSTYRGN